VAKLVLIDGNSLANRAFYAIPNLTNKDGFPTNAIYGFINMLNRISKDEKPDYVAVTFDAGKTVFRHEMYADYKKDRKGMPDELRVQMPVLKEILETMGLYCIELAGYEADDLIGAIAKKAEESGLAPLIITGDRDELQLATDKTKVIITRKGVTEFELYDRDAMIERYGFTPEQFIDFKGLMGDPSDNIPGIPGVGV